MFWDSPGVILLDILPKGESVNADRYCKTLDRLRHAFRRKRPGLLRSGVVLQRTKEWLERYRWDIIPHPAHIPDLAFSDFHLFGPLKRHLGGKKFEDEDELIDILPKGESVNADRYCKTLDRLRHAFRRKRPGLLRSGVVLQHVKTHKGMA
ncbi:histone-lysine N-methyltransferase SETMAR [Plakobranchus ocellatus]|uniref:Histone-lysine N-methyltransferase SETMAR n=1 Tax=Plakobranchus ocellatus TaxID=259542 RepID=A0AAV3Z3J3_9GAST|nr:histone-lysine N-methyltransferase SETMAR [Plakobranchus ocellatus]